MSIRDLVDAYNNPDVIDRIRQRIGMKPLYRNNAGELPVSREIVSGDDKAKKWLVEYKFRIVGGYSIHHVWEDMQ